MEHSQPLFRRARSGARSGAAHQRGFTLIELMVVVAVVAILASIALPSYNEAVRKGRRGQAKADVMQLAQNAERYHTSNNSYVGFETWMEAKDPDAFKSPRDGTQRYTLAVAEETATAFSISATPISGAGQDKDKCGTLSIDSTGKKAASTGLEDCF